VKRLPDPYPTRGYELGTVNPRIRVNPQTSSWVFYSPFNSMHTGYMYEECETENLINGGLDIFM